MTDEKKAELYLNVKKHFGLIEKIAAKSKVKRLQVYRVLTGRSNNAEVLLYSSELYLKAELERKKILRKVQKNQELAESF